MCDSKISDEELIISQKSLEHNVPISKESYYFRQLFNSKYDNKFALTIPYFWMPRWSTTNDPSARTLNIYNDNIKKM